MSEVKNKLENIKNLKGFESEKVAPILQRLKACKSNIDAIKAGYKSKKDAMLEAIEAEKERLRAERRAANPDGITANTSKKKLQQQQQREQEAAKAAAAREYAAKKGIVIEEEDKPTVMSGIPSRPYCKGRNYDPNRYASQNTEE